MSVGRSPSLLAILLGAVSATGFAPLNLWSLTLASLIGLVWLVGRASDMRRAALLGWCYGLGQFVVGLNWIATAFTYQAAMPAWLGWLAVVLLSLYLALWPGVATGLAWRLGKGDHARITAALAATWLLTEWLRGWVFTGFPWNPLGAVWVPLPPISRVVALVGALGLSGLTILLAGAILMLAARRGRAAAALAAPALVLVVASSLLPSAPGATGQRITIVQPNIGQDEKWREGLEAAHRVAHMARSGRPGTAAEPRLLLWPEAAVAEFLEEEPLVRRALTDVLGPRDLLLAGGVALQRNAAGEAVSATNSLFVLDAAGRIRTRYDKAHLVPYGEYLPMRPLLSLIGLSRLAPGDLDFQPGPGPRTLDLPGFPAVGVQICYEIIFSGKVVDAAHRPAFLFNPSNDAWFGAWGPPQHLAQARLRAIEEGLPVVRATPTGISAVITADGRLAASLPWRTAGTIDIRLPGALPPSPFARAGNLIPLTLALILIGAVIALGRTRRYAI